MLRVGGLGVRFAFKVFNLCWVWPRTERGALLEEVGHISDLKEQKNVTISLFKIEPQIRSEAGKLEILRAINDDRDRLNTTVLATFGV